MAGSTADLTQKPGAAPVILMGQTATSSFGSDPDTGFQKMPATETVQNLAIKG